MPKKTARPGPRERLPDGRAAGAKAGAGTASDRLMALQHRLGNRALGRLLTGGPPPIGRPSDPAEARADAHVARAEKGERASGPRMSLGGVPGLGGGRRLSATVQKAIRPQFKTDPRDVRLHSGPDVDLASRAMGAQGFTFGRDVFVRSDRRPHQPGGMKVLRHEMAHIDAEGGRGRVIRRMMGLPSAAEAKAAGGTSGWGMINKGDWGLYRSLLDQFRAVDETKTSEQTALLESLSAVSSRISKSGYSAEKKAFVQAQMPQVKRLYYQVALKPKVYDEVADEARADRTNQRGRLQTAIDHRMEKLRLQVKKKTWQTMDPKTRPSTPMGVTIAPLAAPRPQTLLDRLDDAPLTMNFPPANLGYFTADSDIKQFWELESDKAAEGERKGPRYGSDRKKAEDVMGYTTSSNRLISDGERAHRPISCGLNVFGDARGAAPGYGKWHFKFKDSVKSRATYLSRDSVNHVKREVQLEGQDRVDHIGVRGHLDGVLASNIDMLAALIMNETGHRDLGVDADHDGRSRKFNHATVHDILSKKNYLEVQVHGGLNIDDIDYLAVDVPQNARDRTTEAQKAEGVLVDAWKAKYPGKARVRWHGGVLDAPSGSAPAPRERQEEDGYFKDARTERNAAVDLLDDLAHKRWGPALTRFKTQDIGYGSTAPMASAKWVKWFRGTSGALNTARVDAKSLWKATPKDTELDAHLGQISRVAGVASGVDFNRFWATNHPFARDMVQKIAWYLINALPQGTLHDAIAEEMVDDREAGEAHPVAVLMMGGAGVGKGAVKALPGVKLAKMVDVDADDVKTMLPSYRKMVQDRDEKAAYKAHPESQKVVANALSKAITARRHVLYDATGANAATYEGGRSGVGGDRGLLAMLKDQGYETRVVMVHAPTDVAVQRARDRGARTGRHVPEGVVRSTHFTASSLFRLKWAGHARIDKVSIYDNSGDAPRLVWEKAGAGRLSMKQRKELDGIIG